MNYKFDYILEISRLGRYQPQIDWLYRPIKLRKGFDVSKVFTHLLIGPRDWPHVTVVDGASTTRTVYIERDGPLCTACAVYMDTTDTPVSSRHWGEGGALSCCRARAPEPKDSGQAWAPTYHTVVR